MTRRLLAAAPAAVVAALALANAPAQVKTAMNRLEETPLGIARSAEAARRELYGAPYAAAIAEIGSHVPADGAYAIVGELGRENVEHALRCDLAPRTPILLRAETVCGNWLLDRSFAPVPDLAVFVSADGTPSVVETRSILSSLWSGLTGPQAEIPGWMDEPAEGRTVAGRFLVGGWCQERGGRTCVSIRVWMDGVEVDAARIERFPRPDVQAAVPGMGDCSRAGWRTVFEGGALTPGRHCVAAALVVADGRHRRVGPWAFTVAP
jgi:hypothetical protein